MIEKEKGKILVFPRDHRPQPTEHPQGISISIKEYQQRKRLRMQELVATYADDDEDYGDFNLEELAERERIGQKVRNLREKHNLTQAGLVAKIEKRYNPRELWHLRLQGLENGDLSLQDARDFYKKILIVLSQLSLEKPLSPGNK